MNISEPNKFKKLWRTVKVGYFLAVRQVKRGALWINILIISVMVFTFLNLVVVSGILVGLIEGSVKGLEQHYTGDIIISNLDNKSYIQKTDFVTNVVSSTPEVKDFTKRYLRSGSIHKERKKIIEPSEKRETVNTIMAGIDPSQENRVTDLKSLLIKGEYLEEDDSNEILIGALLLKQYSGFESEAFPVLEGVGVGSEIKVEVDGHQKEVEIKGILRSKVDEVDRRVFFNNDYFRKLIGRFDKNVDEIAVQLKKSAKPSLVKSNLLNSGIGSISKVQTRKEAEPKFLKDLKTTFSILGTIVSSIGLIVAIITVFIVIFINAITRRKYIGILKGVGIRNLAIEMAYVFQALFYALVGTVLGLGLVFLIIKPYISVNPIDFPFSDGILVATFWGTFWRALTLISATFVAGYLPARLIVNQNTLDAILER
ncbi:MAG: ABC transporter permease [Candidatus Magasanikbacteria bacterium]